MYGCTVWLYHRDHTSLVLSSILISSGLGGLRGVLFVAFLDWKSKREKMMGVLLSFPVLITWRLSIRRGHSLYHIYQYHGTMSFRRFKQVLYFTHTQPPIRKPPSCLRSKDSISVSFYIIFLRLHKSSSLWSQVGSRWGLSAQAGTDARAAADRRLIYLRRGLPSFFHSPRGAFPPFGLEKFA
jgi:hypothetical protein